MSRLRFFTPALVCLLVVLQLAGAVPAAEAFDGGVDDPSTDERFDVFDDERLGKASIGDGVNSSRLSEEPVGLAADRGFAPEGTVALALGVEPVGFQEAPGESEPEAENDVAGFAAALVFTARDEARTYVGLDECGSSTLRSRIGEYWQSIDIGWNGCTDQPWSAAFISAMMRAAGAGSQFRYSAAHREYIHDAFAGGRGLYGTVIDANGATAHEGDLVCSGRQHVSGWSYASFQNWYASGAGQAIPTHCDIVVAVSGSTVTVVGGNVGDAVTQTTRALASYALVLPLADPLAWEAEAFDEAHAEAVAWLNEQQFGFEIAPPARGQVVHLKNYMWIHGDWTAANFTAQEHTVEVTVTVTPISSIWRLEETATGRTATYHCAGRGHPYVNPDDESTCGHTFDHSSAVVGDVALTTAVGYELTVVSSLDDSESNFTDGEVVPPLAPGTSDVNNIIELGDEQDAVSKPFQFPLWVNEVLTWGIEEDGEFSTPGFNTDPIVPEEDGYNCSLGENITYYGTVGIPLRLMGVSCGDAFGLLEHVKDGLLACGGGVVRSITQIVELLVGAVTDPVGTVKDGIAGIQALFQMAQDDLGAFGTTVALGMIGVEQADWDNAADDDARRNLVISGICGVAFEALLGGVGKRIFNLLPIGRRPRGTPDPEVEAPRRPRPCRSSFPTGTPVRMGTGELVAIEDVRPGDLVRAADPLTGVWSNQVVLAQWSYLDTDQMTTAELEDGSNIIATDHHLFWVHSRSRWVELQDVAIDDELLTPQALTAVTNVTTHPQTETLVWELDTAGPDTFTVHTGTVDLLVHNADGCPFGAWTDRQRQGIEPGTELRGLDPVPAHRLTNLLTNFRTRDIFDNNGRRFIIDKTAMERILARHHPRYFDSAGARTRNSSFAGSATPDDIVGMMQRAMREGTPHPSKPNNMIIDIDGVTYDLAVDPITGRVANHFSPLDAATAAELWADV